MRGGLLELSIQTWVELFNSTALVMILPPLSSLAWLTIFFLLIVVYWRAFGGRRWSEKNPLIHLIRLFMMFLLNDLLLGLPSWGRGYTPVSLAAVINIMALLMLVLE